MNGSTRPPILLDCTLRDGGYYNNWDFEPELVSAYLAAMAALPVDYVELGLRSLLTDGFKGAFAYTTDGFVRRLPIPAGLKLGVMVNASELVGHEAGPIDALSRLFVPAAESPISLVRVASHLGEFEAVLPGCEWLKQQGYVVGINLMQIADRTTAEIQQAARLASQWPIDVLYFADSMGSMNPTQTSDIISALQSEWKGPIGIHTHDNMGQGMANSMCAVDHGVSWVDGTVTGMGRGAGNSKTEYLAIELAERSGRSANISPLLSTIARHFKPMQDYYGWGTNTYYFLAGKYGIHPTFVQEMLANPRFDAVDVLAVLDYLREAGGKKYSLGALDSGLNFFKGESEGSWEPATEIAGRDVLIVGPGPEGARHRQAIEDFITEADPVVLALNTVSVVRDDLIDFRVASHPVRLLEDGLAHRVLPQPLVTPASKLPPGVRAALEGKELRDFGISIEAGEMRFDKTHCVVPSSLVAAYALAIAASGRASRILLAGFDGYASDDPRSVEMNRIFGAYRQASGAPPLLAITPSRYELTASTIYALRGKP
jgi:4-hydroxy 2-oxovalerate aldolase